MESRVDVSGIAFQAGLDQLELQRGVFHAAREVTDASLYITLPEASLLGPVGS